MIFNGFGAVAVDCGGHIVRNENEERGSVCAWKHHGSTLVGQFCRNVLRAKSTLFFWRGAQQLGDCNGACRHGKISRAGSARLARLGPHRAEPLKVPARASPSRDPARLGVARVARDQVTWQVCSIQNVISPGFEQVLCATIDLISFLCSSIMLECQFCP